MSALQAESELPLSTPGGAEIYSGARRAIAPRSRVPKRFRYLVSVGGVGFGFTNRLDAATYASRLATKGLQHDWQDRGRFR